MQCVKSRLCVRNKKSESSTIRIGWLNDDCPIIQAVETRIDRVEKRLGAGQYRLSARPVRRAGGIDEFAHLERLPLQPIFFHRLKWEPLRVPCARPYSQLRPTRIFVYYCKQYTYCQALRRSAPKSLNLRAG